MPKQRAKYKITNWSTYNKALIQRGSLTIWFESSVLEQWHAKKESEAKACRPLTYSDSAIELCLMLKGVYHLTYRATEGLIQSLFEWGRIELQVPSYTQMQRRSKQLNIKLKRASSHQGAIDIVIDSTGLKIYGEGEWKVRQHGASKRRCWKKLHLGVDPLSHEIRCHVLTDHRMHDGEALPDLLDQIDAPIERCAADGAYDKRACYRACHDRQVELITPPRCNAVENVEPDPESSISERNKAIRRISALTQSLGCRDKAKKQWKHERDYHIRSISETAMKRFKGICGNRLFSRINATQKTEVSIKINMLNKMTALGMPQTVVNYI